MRSALAALRLDKPLVVHAGRDAWPMDERIEAVPLEKLFDHLRDERERD